MMPGAPRQLLVSIHDVTPAHDGRIKRILDLLGEFGVRRYALLVVPNWHGGWPLDRHPEFVESLRRQQAAGAEIFLHGLRHDEDGLQRSLVQRLRAAGRTNREGEFLILSPAEAARRIDRGLQVLRTCGIDPVGFVAPSWLPGRDALRILRERNLGITEGFFAILDTNSGRRLFVPALSWSTQRPWRSAACAVIANARLRIEAYRRIVRVAIHPPDIDVPAVTRSLRTILPALLEVRETVTYRRALSIE